MSKQKSRSQKQQGHNISSRSTAQVKIITQANVTAQIKMRKIRDWRKRQAASWNTTNKKSQLNLHHLPCRVCSWGPYFISAGPLAGSYK